MTNHYRIVCDHCDGKHWQSGSVTTKISEGGLMRITMRTEIACLFCDEQGTTPSNPVFKGVLPTKGVTNV